MPNLKLYGDSGFVTTGRAPKASYLRESRVVWTPGDPACEEYLRTPSLAIIDKSNPALVIEMARKAVELFGGNQLEYFFTANISHGEFKSDLHFKFLEDTVLFLRTGKRSMSINTWIDLLVDSQDSLMKKKPGVKVTYSMTSKLYRGLTVQDWLSKDGGLVDLVFSMFIIFGEHRKWLH